MCTLQKDLYVQEKMVCFDDVFQFYGSLIDYEIRKLHIYKNKDEFYQVGLIGLWKAYQRFDPQKGKFITFASKTIRGYLLAQLTKMNAYEEKHVWKEPDNDSSYIYQPIPLLEREAIDEYCFNLSENEKKWVYYSMLEQLKPKEIALLEDVSVETVKSWRKRALKKLRREFAAGTRTD